MLFVILILLLLLYIYILVQRKFNYWKKKNVPYLKPQLIFGNYKDYILLKSSLDSVNKDICDKFPEAPYVGTFMGMKAALVVNDPELIKLITTEKFYYFNGREVSDYTDREVLTQNLFFTHGDRWKVLRQNLTPLFTSAKIKNMFYLVKKCSLELECLLDNMLRTSQELEVTHLSARYMIDSISSCAFGIDSNSMGTDSEIDNNPFKYISTKIFEVSNISFLKVRARSAWPQIFYGLGMKAFSTEVNDFFHKLITEVFSRRSYKPSNRNDFVDLLLNLKLKEQIVGDSISNLKTGEKKTMHLKLDDDLLVGQCVLFFGAGFETSAFTMAFILYELAKNYDVQKRATAEVDEYLKRHTNGIEYDCVKELQYISACLDETLRLYPVIGVITREVAEDYTLPTGLKLERGVVIHIPVMSLHRNPKYFPEPNIFRPERFLGEEFTNIKPYTYMPFGVGQRSCIGMRFAKTQLISALVAILKNYKLELAAGMPQPLPLHPCTITQQPLESIRLLFLPRN